jgi:hypothetical protein
MNSFIVDDRIRAVKAFLTTSPNYTKPHANHPKFSTAIFKAVKNAYERAAREGWGTIYWAVDLHDTVIMPSYQPGIIGQSYPFALDTLYWLLSFPETGIILWSSMSKEELARHRSVLFEGVADHEVRVFLNENPDIGATRYANFDQKMYFNMLLDDKAGFDHTTDWQLIQEAVNYYRPRNIDRMISDEFIEVTEHA